MPDLLNELLRWSVTASTEAKANQNTDLSNDNQLQLKWTPGTAHAGTSALHLSDKAPADLSPASTPGPATPKEGFPLPLPAGVELPRANREDLTTEMLDLIMGKGDSIIMKEKMAIATDENQSIDSRVKALDDFEMARLLIELIDNANNMPILKLWDPLITLLASPHPEIVAHTCWIIGTAVQNNIIAQAALFMHNVFPCILDIIYPSSSSISHPSSVRAKATYALSSSLKHWPLASSVLMAPLSNGATGYSAIKRGVCDSDCVVKRKMAFLVGTLVMQSGETYKGEIPKEVQIIIEEKSKLVLVNDRPLNLIEGLKVEGIFTALIDGLKQGVNDVEFEENALRTLVGALETGGLADGDKAELKLIWEKWDKKGREERGFVGEDCNEVSRALAA
nr:hsp70-like protein [Cryptococcus depauperatus CBS 7841]